MLGYAVRAVPGSGQWEAVSKALYAVKELSDVCEGRRLSCLLVVRFCWRGWTLRDSGGDGWCGGQVLDYAVRLFRGSSCV
jgi:hypothetical protein